jgi:hypothetical protein
MAPLNASSATSPLSGLDTRSPFAALPLAGTWALELDQRNVGIAERWYERSLKETVQLPGSLAAQGIGEEITVQTPWVGSIFDPSYYTAESYAPYRQPGNIKIPFWLQPEHAYRGAAWYQRELTVPEDWAGRRIVLRLERVHWESQVWLGDRCVGARHSLSVPHEYDLGCKVGPGKHRLTIRVDNSIHIDVGENSHSVTDHTQGNWNGMIGRIELFTTPPVWIEDAQVYPSAEPREVRVRGRLARGDGANFPSTVAIKHVSTAAAGSVAGVLRRELPINPAGEFDGTFSLPETTALWDEFSPVLHAVTISLPNGETREIRYGLRTIAAQGNQLLINGRKLFIRGTLECAIFPLSGHPPTDVDSWKRIIAVARSYGLNSLRFHSWCPPEAAFIAGDESGFYFQIEAASWPNQSTTLGDGKPVDDWLETETQEILRVYGNHPSFLLMASSNEPGGEAERDTYLNAWVKRHAASDPRRLFTSGAGWPQLIENQFHITSDPRIQHWEEGLNSRINALPPETRTDYRAYIDERSVPVISHEIGQWCVYPDFGEMPEYRGYLKPRNFEIFRERLEAAGLGHLARDFFIASGKLQTLCYKEDIESALRTPRMGGFQLLGLQDFPGQGTALVGVVNPFWGAKPYVSAAEFRRFCNVTVPLARLAQHAFTTADLLTAECEVTHFGAAELRGAKASWRVQDSHSQTVAQGQFATHDIAIGGAQKIGTVQLALSGLPAPARYKLVLEVHGAETDAENDWDFWVYPAAHDARTNDASSIAMHSVRFVTEFESALAALARGESVLLSLRPELVKNEEPAVKLGFSTVFWNTSWTNRQAPTTLGILCDPAHPALASFPTEAHSNWQWWYVLKHAAALRLTALPRELNPIVRVIDDWFTARSLALVIEARVGPGKLIVASVDLETPDNPVVRQLRASLLSYAASDRFAPTVNLTPEQIRAL